MLSTIIGFLLNSFSLYLPLLPLLPLSPSSVSLSSFCLPLLPLSPSLFLPFLPSLAPSLSLSPQGKKLKKELEDLDNDDGEVSDEDEAADIEPQEYKKAGVENPEAPPTVRWISDRASNCVLTI